MPDCLILINRNAGGGKKISADKIKNFLGDGYAYSELDFPCDNEADYKKFDCVAVCGGDGTLSSVMQNLYETGTEIKYFPAGTLNDKAKAKRYADKFHINQAKKTLTESLPLRGKEINPEVEAGCEFVENRLSKQLTANKNDKSKCAETNFDAYEEVIEKIKKPIKHPRPSKALTENHAYESKNYNSAPIVIGKAGDKIFTYVLAAGSFTPIGYTAKVKLKQKIGVLAYIGQIVREYKIHRIKARLSADEQSFSGEFTLIMFLKSPRCFGFNFNRDFSENDESGHLIAIRSPKHNGLLGKIEMFFPFFRVFFIGLKKPKDGKIIFRRVKDAGIKIDEPYTFCNDGEKCEISGDSRVTFKRTKCKISIINKY